MQPDILIVDDERYVLEGLIHATRREACRIFTATSAEEALRVLRERPIDVVVSDEKMPGRSGLQLLADVRREFPGTVRILLTGVGSGEMAVKAADANVDRFLTKPYNGRDLMAVVNEALRVRSARLGSA